MIPVTQAVKTAVRQAVKQTKVTVSWNTSMSQTASISSDDALVSVKKEAEGYYLESTLRKITIVTVGTAPDLLDKKVSVLLQVKVAGGTWGDIPWGSFTIMEAKTDEAKGTTTYTGYGGVALMQNTEYVEGQLTFPTTVKGLTEQVAQKFGIEIETDMTTLPNYNAPIATDLWAKISGTTYRDILEEIAGATASVAVIGRGNDQLNFYTPPIASASETLTEANLLGFTIGENWGAANAVVLSRKPQNDNIEVKNDASIAQTGQRTDLVIANNQILDKQRETTATPILDTVLGWTFRNATLKTEGHGYHEVGDRLDVTIGNTTYKTIVTKNVITLDGGITETLTSVTPDIDPIDYAKTGSITKTVYNTSLAVDKQQQQIEAIVSRQDSTDDSVNAQFTQITQNLTAITAMVQSTGGGNLVKNSVGYGKASDGTLNIWQYSQTATTANVKSQSSTASLNAGAVSGYEIDVTGTSISQELTLTAGEAYNLSFRAKKGTTGTATVTITNSIDTFTVTLADQTAYNWRSQDIDFVPNEGANVITITSSANTQVQITDLMVTNGSKATWRQASGEIYNAQVSLDQGGVRVSSSAYTGDYVEITPLEFAGYSNASGTMRKVFSLNRDTTEVEKLEARSSIKMEPIKIVPISNSSYSGWAFVKEES